MKTLPGEGEGWTPKVGGHPLTSDQEVTLKLRTWQDQKGSLGTDRLAMNPFVPCTYGPKRNNEALRLAVCLHKSTDTIERRRKKPDSNKVSLRPDMGADGPPHHDWTTPE